MPAAWVTLPEDVERMPGCLNTDFEILVARKNFWLLPPRTQDKLIPSATLESLEQSLHAKSSAPLKDEIYKGSICEDGQISVFNLLLARKIKSEQIKK